VACVQKAGGGSAYSTTAVLQRHTICHGDIRRNYGRWWMAAQARSGGLAVRGSAKLGLVAVWRYGPAEPSASDSVRDDVTGSTKTVREFVYLIAGD